MTVSKEISDLPPSAKLIWKALEEEGPMTQKELVEWTCMPHNTVRRALTKLEDSGEIRAQNYTRDARQKLYQINN